jgi:hypothetical protein
MTSQELETFLKNQDSEIKHLITVKTQSQEARLLAIEQKLVAWWWTCQRLCGKHWGPVGPE